jgi:3-hydroxybutyryl-CoA dehydrogenase
MPGARSEIPLTIAVIGAGASGRDFAVACAAAGFSVILEDVMPEKLRNAAAEFARIGREVTLVMTVEDAVREADLAMDFVPDDLESKLEIWSMIDRMAPPKTILCTPSQALSITDLASCTYRPDRCVMVRGPLAGQGTVSLLSAAATSATTLTTAATVFTTLGYQVVSHPDPDLPQLLKNMHATTL